MIGMESLQDKMPRWAWVTLSLLSVVVLLFLRAPQSFLEPQFWAEDLAEFWLDQYQLGFVEAAFTNYGGYLHMAPRLVALIVSFFPVDWHAALYGLAALMLSLWTAFVIALLPLPRLMAAMLAVSLFLIAQSTTGEIWGTPTNVQWILAAALPLIAATMSPASQLLKAQQLVFVGIASLSGPFSIFASPLWAWRLWKFKDRFSRVLSSVALLCALTQLIFLIVAASSEEGFAPPITLLLERAFSEPVIGARSTIVAIFLIGFLIHTAHNGEFAWLRLACLVFAGGVLLAVLWKVKGGDPLLDRSYYMERYFYLPAVMVAFCAVSLMWDHRRLSGALLWLSMILSMFFSGPTRDIRIDYRREWHLLSEDIGKKDVTVTVQPGWQVKIPPRTEDEPDNDQGGE